MKRSIVLALLISAAALQATAASYLVVLKDGTAYKAKARWTVVNGKAMVALEEGGTLQLDPNLIDIAKTDEVNRLGLGNVKVLDSGTNAAVPARPQEQPSLGSITKLRKPQAQTTATAPPPVQAAPAAQPQLGLPPVKAGGSGLGADVISKFEAAYENVGIFEHDVTSPAPGRLVVKLTTDNEDRVFGAITATAFFMIGVPRSTGAQIDLVELYMQTTTGAAAGRFHMTKDDADRINAKKLTPQSYFVEKVLY